MHAHVTDHVVVRYAQRCLDLQLTAANDPDRLHELEDLGVDVEGIRERIRAASRGVFAVPRRDPNVLPTATILLDGVRIMIERGRATTAVYRNASHEAKALRRAA